MWIWMLFACETETERLDREWDEQFGEIVRQYKRQEAGAPEIEPAAVYGRKLLVDRWRPYGVEFQPYEAKTGAEVGVFVASKAVSDPTPSATYEGGVKGFGGTVTMVAYAHPEGKVVATKSYHCNAPYQSYQTVDINTGARIGPKEEHCDADREGLLKFGARVVDAVPPVGSNVGAKDTQAYLALVDGTLALVGNEVAPTPVKVQGRKVLLVTLESDEVQLQQDGGWVSTSGLAAGPGEVGVIALLKTTLEETPSVTYECGVLGIRGTSELTLVAVPEQAVVARTPVTCELPSEKSAATLADLLPQRSCSPDRDAVKAAIEAAVGAP